MRPACNGSQFKYALYERFYMKHDDRVYIAALVDGEGSILLTKQGGSKYRSPTLTIPSCTHAFMSFLKETAGGNISDKITYKKGHSRSWVWAVRYNATLTLLRAILPYMKEPEKIRRAKLLLTTYKTVTSRNGKYTPKMLKDKKKFEKEFFRYSIKVMSV